MKNKMAAIPNSNKKSTPLLEKGMVPNALTNPLLIFNTFTATFWTLPWQSVNSWSSFTNWITRLPLWRSSRSKRRYRVRTWRTYWRNWNSRWVVTNHVKCSQDNKPMNKIFKHFFTIHLKKIWKCPFGMLRNHHPECQTCLFSSIYMNCEGHICFLIW